MDRFDSKVIERVLKTTKFAAPELKQNNIYFSPPVFSQPVYWVSQWRLNIKEKKQQNNNKLVIYQPAG